MRVTPKTVLSSGGDTGPSTNIGIRTGHASGLVVVDVDDRNGVSGSENLARLTVNYGDLPRTLTAITPHGRHYYFQHPGETVKNSAGLLAKGIDIRADGGYVVAPSSLHASGAKYYWDDAEVPVAQLPDWLRDRLLNNITVKKQETSLSVQRAETILPTELSVIPKGSRNARMFESACTLRGQQAKEYDEIVAILLECNEAKCQPPLDQAEVVRIAQSACRYPAEINTSRSVKRNGKSSMYWFPFDTQEWRADPNIMLMEDYQTGWCIRLMVYAWEQKGYLPADMNKLYKIAGAKTKEIFEGDCELVLAAYEYVVLDGQRLLRHSTLADLYVVKTGIVAQRKKGGEANAAKYAKLKQQEMDETHLLQ